MRGPKATIARFHTVERIFATSKEAYLYLIERFLQSKPDLLETDWQNQFVSKGRSRRYFAREPKQLFEESPHLAENSNNYSRVMSGWFTITNLNNEEKFEILLRLAAIGGWGFGSDWSWRVIQDSKNRHLPSASEL
jgi:hypothetical protein